jgi:hypothetical protein
MPILKGDPSRPRTQPLDGPHRNSQRNIFRLSNITLERALDAPKALAKRFTKFITNYDTGRVEIPKNVIGPRRTGPHLNVGQIPED